jgi:hypothetical protein
MLLGRTLESSVANKDHFAHLAGGRGTVYSQQQPHIVRGLQLERKPRQLDSGHATTLHECVFVSMDVGVSMCVVGV